MIHEGSLIFFIFAYNRKYIGMEREILFFAFIFVCRKSSSWQQMYNQIKTVKKRTCNIRDNTAQYGNIHVLVIATFIAYDNLVLCHCFYITMQMSFQTKVGSEREK